MGVAEHEESDSGIGGQEAFQVVEVVVPTVLVADQRPVHYASPRGPADVVEREIDGRGEDHGVCGTGEGFHTGPHPLKDRGGSHDQFGVRGPTVAPRRPPGERLGHGPEAVVIAGPAHFDDVAQPVSDPGEGPEVVFGYERREHGRCLVRPLVAA